MNIHNYSRAAAALAAIALGASCFAQSNPSGYAAPTPAPGCPSLDWTGGFPNLLQPDAPFPTSDTTQIPTPDCAFHQWSWEAFVWATALLKDPASGATVPRFMMLPTEEDLLSPDANAGKPRLHPLKLAARSNHFVGTANFTEGAGAIVEADGNMLVSQNGYPVYASVHMNESYFDTAKKNLIIDGGYFTQPADSSFSVGAAVFKATWLRLDPGQKAPAGTYTTQAQVPVLQTIQRIGGVTIEPIPGKYTTVTVALIGLHVVGYTENHPEFVWGTFEHQLNSPSTPDNTFPGSGSSPTNFTLYKANTPYAQANLAVTPPQLKLNATTQKLTPVTNAVLENRTGGENQPGGSGNIEVLNQAAHKELVSFKSPQSIFATYNLIGTVWMAPNSYNLSSNQSNAVGSINLANVTAETFVQTATNSNPQNNTNCFLCHNPTSYSFQNPPPAKLQNRLIALSHVLGVGTPYAVPNEISGATGIHVPIDASRLQTVRQAAQAK